MSLSTHLNGLPPFRTPWITIVICVLCIGTYVAQQVVDGRAKDAAERFCSTPGGARYESLMEHLFEDDYQPALCMGLMEGMRQAVDPRAFATERVVRGVRPAGSGEAVGQRLLVRAVMDRFVAYEASVPPTLTASLLYRPTTFDPRSMLVATFAHGGLWHLVNNVLFFFAFGAVLEMFIARWKFAMVFLAIALGAFSAYLATALGGHGENPTVGLSGAVYGMMALVAWLSPRLLILAPMGLMGVWYVGQDVANLVFGASVTGVNLTAHVGGALSGLAIGMIALRKERDALHMRPPVPEPVTTADGAPAQDTPSDQPDAAGNAATARERHD